MVSNVYAQVEKNSQPAARTLPIIHTHLNANFLVVLIRMQNSVLCLCVIVFLLIQLMAAILINLYCIVTFPKSFYLIFINDANVTCN